MITADTPPPIIDKYFYADSKRTCAELVFRDIFTRFEQIIVELPKMDPLLALKEIKVECSKTNWDGYGATPVSASALRDAELFLRSMPSTIPYPHVAPQSNGGILFEWNKAQHKALIVSFQGFGNINYAAILDEKSNRHGSEEFLGSVPKHVQEDLFPLFFKSL